MRSRRRDTAIDLGLCAAMAAYGLPPMLDPSVNDPRATTFGPLLLPTLLAAVLVRRRHPLGAAYALAAACVVSGVPTFNQFRLIVAIPAAMAVLLTLAKDASWRDALAGLTAVLAGLAFVGATDAQLDGPGGLVDMMAFSLPLCLAVWGAGRVMWRRDRVAAQLTERSEQLRRQREATTAMAVEIDRAKLASDLDLVARSRLGAIIELASAAGADATDGRERFTRIEVLGREALDEMRGLLGLLRSTDRGARAPRPTLEQLDALLADARAGGRVVDLHVEGAHRPLPVGIELAVYRTVQHALMAVADEPVTITLRYAPDRLELDIDGLRPEGPTAGAALLAARERITALGGSFTTDAPGPGLRAVRARLPVVPAYV